MAINPEQTDRELVSACTLAEAEFTQKLVLIGRSEFRQSFQFHLTGGQVLSSTRPDVVAQIEWRRIEAVACLTKISDAFVRHVAVFRGLKGDKAIEEYEQRLLGHFGNGGSLVVTSVCNSFGIDFVRFQNEVIAHTKRELQARWPRPGRPSKQEHPEAKDDLARQIEQLLSGRYKGKFTQLALDLRVDPKTLNKIRRGQRVTDTTRDRVRDAIEKLKP
jgi:hypothetical protein